MDSLASLPSFFEPWLLFLSEDPILRSLQLLMLLTGFLVVFLVFYTTRDILLRTHSFFYMLACIVLVAALPVVGFLLYLLIRPARTIKEREVENTLNKLLHKFEKHAKADEEPRPKKTKKPKKND